MPCDSNLGVFSLLPDDLILASCVRMGVTCPIRPGGVIPDAFMCRKQFLARTASLDDCAAFRSAAGVYWLQQSGGLARGVPHLWQ
jgi:hypothetical protein